MIDYEQLYYDLLHEIKKIEKKNELLEQELYIYKSFQKNKDLKKVIVETLLKYFNKKGVNNE